MKRMNFAKYVPYPAVTIPRQWPDRRITKAPRWCSVDLRDGNQALSIPMGVDEKLAMFESLVAMGFKEIEVGFPSASATEFRFVRRLIEEGRIPDDVTIQVLTQARHSLIERTFASLRGVRHAIVHLYNSTSRVQREVVFRKSPDEIIALAVEGTRLVKELKKASGLPDIRFEYSPESFTGTEPEFALAICHAVMDAWEPCGGEKIIFNLPSTVEMSTPNIFADRIEWFCNSIRHRESVIVSVHTHNDRGTAVAAAELAVMAGAERVEGALFGNGERSGNMDIITMAMNLFSQGVDPELDFSDIDSVKEMYRRSTGMEVHPRHPYAGELVYTAFSGSHQDAINKGMKACAHAPVWDVPYLPIDPRDVGRNYESIIRINSQSGKGGIAFVLEKDFGIQLPRWIQRDFGRVIQEIADETGKELSSHEIFESFMKEYIHVQDPCRIEKCHIDTDEEEGRQGNGAATRVSAVIRLDGVEREFSACGTGPVDAFVSGFTKTTGREFTVEEYAEHAVSRGADALAAAYVGMKDADGQVHFGAGMDPDISIASFKAVMSAFNRSVKRQ